MASTAVPLAIRHKLCMNGNFYGSKLKIMNLLGKETMKVERDLKPNFEEPANSKSRTREAVKMLMPFPSPLERIAAAALLLLSESATPPSLSSSENSADAETTGKLSSCSSFESSTSKSCSSSLTGHFHPEEIRMRRPRSITVAAPCYEFKRQSQVGKRVHFHKSKKSDHEKSIPNKVWSGFELSKEALSLSSNSAGTHDICRGWTNNGTESGSKKPGEKHVGSAHMRSRAEAILRFLTSGSASEVRIRKVLGDSPDTSKALRILLKLEEVKRSGTGGRQDPFIYTLARKTADPQLSSSTVTKMC